MVRHRSSPIDGEIGRRVKLRRLDLGLSQTALGDALGLTFQQVQKYEKGSNRISAGRLKQIAQILDVSIGYFYDDDIGGSKQRQSTFAFLDSAYSLRLMRAFSQLHERAIQVRVIELVEGLAAHSKTPGSRAR